MFVACCAAFTHKDQVVVEDEVSGVTSSEKCMREDEEPIEHLKEARAAKPVVALPASTLAPDHIQISFEGPEQAREVTVTIPNPVSTGVGIDVEHTGGMLLILRIHDGLISKWNADHPASAVAHFDRIIEVNGVRGSVPKLMEALGSGADPIKLVFRSVQEFEVTLKKGCHEKKLGLDISEMDGQSVLVRKVNTGLVGQWNSSAPPPVKVRDGDRIMASNGIRGCSTKILKNIASSESLVITVGRQLAD